MRKHPSVFFLASVLAALFVTLPGSPARSAESEAAGPLRIMTGPPGGEWYSIGDALAGALVKAGLPAANIAGGGLENLRAVSHDNADIGFTLYSFLAAAGAGNGDLPEVEIDNIQLLANLYPQVLYIVVRKEVVDRYRLGKLEDLLRVDAPIRFSTLGKGTGSEFIFGQLLKSGYGTSFGKLTEQGWLVSYDSYKEIARRFLDGELDVCAYTAGPGTYLIPALEEKKLEAVLLPIDEEKLDIMTHQFMTIAYTIRKDDYQSAAADVATLGDYSCLVARKSLDEETVYRISAALWENKLALTAVSRDMEHLSPRFAISGQSAVHPGSRRFWEAPEMLELKRKAGHGD